MSFDKVVTVLEADDMLVSTMLDRLGRSTQSMLVLAKGLQVRGAGMRMLYLGGADMDTHIPMGSTVFTALAPMELVNEGG
ncbi:recombinase family protein [Kocuria sp. M4R2S49]|uniref:recombinase family protein n=1 Tax=Kocuria rhizosphaericola TaxID=3376284 RepID=UPI00379238AD